MNADNNSDRPDDHLTEKAVAAILGLSRDYLRRLRVEGNGPPFRKFGAAVRYRRGDVLTWAAARTATVTARSGTAAIREQFAAAAAEGDERGLAIAKLPPEERPIARAISRGRRRAEPKAAAAADAAGRGARS